MEPLLIDSVRELKCLSDVTKNGTWNGNFNYWTGGTQKDCRGSWSWCGKDGARMFNDGVAWEKDQPDNKGGREDCIHLKLKKNATGQPQEFLLTDRNCTDKYVLACKVYSGVCCWASL
jgi:Lectin C-type domain